MQRIRRARLNFRLVPEHDMQRSMALTVKVFRDPHGDVEVFLADAIGGYKYPIKATFAQDRYQPYPCQKGAVSRHAD